MTHSMTAFARVQGQFAANNLCWEIKSVNHRYLDVLFRLPEAFRFLEPSFRTLMRDKISRGKLECQLKFNDASGDNQSLHINENLVNALLETGNHLATSRQIANDLSLNAVLSWPGVVQMAQPDMDSLGHHAEHLFEQALVQLLAARQSEGQVLQAHVSQRLQRLSNEISSARQQVSLLVEQTRDKLFNRLNVLRLEVDNTRVEQEIALLVARLDVSEELDRLDAHVDEVGKTLASKEAAGRRLDFLMQELNREANTLSSKSDSVALTQTAVEMKVLIEQMREQIQNIE